MMYWRLTSTLVLIVGHRSLVVGHQSLVTDFPAHPEHIVPLIEFESYIFEDGERVEVIRFVECFGLFVGHCYYSECLIKSFFF